MASKKQDILLPHYQYLLNNSNYIHEKLISSQKLICEEIPSKKQ